MAPKILLLLCFAAALRPGYCEPKSSDDDERARLPEFLTELDLASLEASEEDIEALKTVVKRLAPEKNVFFGNEELLNEWLKGAGVMGQPGVDFPALTTIPTTSFSCRGLKGGYYADLETNCQVFHICDNGRKISFLCPNGTIFQQSQLICDWWFKVDCSKSTELYEQSAEQLAEEERKRSEAKRMNSEFHRSSGENGDNSGQRNYYQSQNSNYDGRQNGRTNPFGQTSNKNQIPDSAAQRQNTEPKSNTKSFDPSQIYGSNGLTANQYNQINDLAATNVFKVSQDGNVNNGQSGNNYNSREQQQQQQNPSTSRSSPDRGNYRPVDRQQNQLVEGANREDKRQFNYEQRGTGKFPGSNQNSYQHQQQQSGRPNKQSFDYSSTNRNGGRDSDRRNFAKSSGIGSTIGSSDYELSSNRVTPSYTETTTFRTSTPSPIREYQQLAESAAFASNRGNRFNDAYSSSQFNSYYNFNNNNNSNNNGNDNGNNGNNNNNSKPRVQQKSTDKPRQKSITPTPGADKISGSYQRVRTGSPSLPFPTFQPIYKPRTSNSYPSMGYETTTLGSTVADVLTTTSAPYTSTDYYTQNNQERTTYTDNLDYSTTASYQANQDYQTTSESPNAFTEDYQQNSVTPSGDHTTITNVNFFENTTPTIITSGSYVNAKTYTSSKTLSTGGNYKSSSSSGYTTSKPYSKTQEYRQNSVATVGPTNESTVRRADASSQYVTTSANYRDITIDQNTVSTRNPDDRGDNHQQGRAPTKNSPRTNAPSTYRPSQNSITTSTEKPSRSSSTAAFQQSGSTGKTLSPYDTSITYQQGKVMSTLGPYVPFTKNYAYSTTTASTTAKPPAYTATVPTYSSTASVYRSANAKSLGGKVRVSSSLAPPRNAGRLRSGSAAYLPEKKSDVSTYLSKKHNLNERPPIEREHAMSMLQSLRGLEATTPSLLGVTNSTRSGLNIPTSSGPSTLHSLALYFATASDDYDSAAESRTDSASESESAEVIAAKVVQDNNTSVELPKTILTQHTINSYAELFNLNNALEGNSSAESNIYASEAAEDSDDLDIQQSEGPIDGARRSNSTKLRELAQVFTHALSAYLQDPDTFKKILTEIRPTEPSVTTVEDDRFTATTFVPTTSEDYPSVTKEKDEVLDFSDDTTPPRSRRPTTVYPATTTDSSVTGTGFTQQDYYTTSSDYYTTTATPQGSSPSNPSSNPSGPDNSFAFQVNHVFGNSANGGNDLNSGSGLFYPEEATGPSGPTALGDVSNNDGLNDYTDNYFPSDDSSGTSRIGGFQNNTSAASTYEPYGKHVKPYDATPIGDNYVASSTPASYIQDYQFQTTKRGEQEDGVQRLTDNLNPSTHFPQQQVIGNSQNSVTSFSDMKQSASGVRKETHDRKSPTTKPFRIRYYDPTTVKPEANNRESLVTAGSVYSTYRGNYNDFADSNKGITDKPTVVTSVVTSRTMEPPTRAGHTEPGGFNTVTNSNDPTTTNFDENRNRQNDRKLNNHWTSSPTVTQLWESTVFVDPKRINQGLVSGSGEVGGTTIEAGTIDYTEATERSPSLAASRDNINHRYHESLVTDATSSGVSSRNTNNVDYPSSPWRWADGSSSTSTISKSSGNNDNDSPTAFTLLPQTSYTTTMEQNVVTATPSPIYTTRSSITTTITSSVTSTSSSTSGGAPLRQDGLPISTGLIQQQSSNRPKHGLSGTRESINDTENEIIKAQNMFGKLNTTSTSTLMRVMKQADTNATVRQLVLLLINHCNGPMNKTMEEEKEQLLDALLRMPVNEFTSEESKELVAGINRLHLPIGKGESNAEKRSTSTTTIPSMTAKTATSSLMPTTTTDEPTVTTFRSKKGRRFKSNAEEASPTSSGRNGEDIGTAETSNALSLEDTTASDTRALELLRSLYTIAAKWG